MATATRDTNGRSKGENGAGDLLNSKYALVAGAATAGAALGWLAMFGRKTLVQAPTILAGEWPEALAAEHKMTLALFDALEATEARNTIRRSLHLAQLKHALAKHALEEENVIYPAMREAGDKEAADELNAEHGYVKQYLYELENMPKDSPEFLTKLADFRRDIEAHMHEEEDVLFPRLYSQLGEEKNKVLTRKMNKEGFKLA